MGIPFFHVVAETAEAAVDEAGQFFEGMRNPNSSSRTTYLQDRYPGQILYTPRAALAYLVVNLGSAFQRSGNPYDPATLTTTIIRTAYDLVSRYL
ncbi:MAG: hypothetical protein HY600_06170 [Candidatus Omnitrophica bacterium]|nr:hypothetical protein [Candidatus Omnitrophota bacterium]